MQKSISLILICFFFQSCYFHKSNCLIKKFQFNSINKFDIRFNNLKSPNSSYLDIVVNKDDTSFKKVFFFFDTILSKMKKNDYSKKRLAINKESSRKVNLRIYLYRNNDLIEINPYLQKLNFSKPRGTISLGRTYDIAYYSRESYYNDKALTNEFILLCNQIINIKNSLAKKDSLINYSLPLFE